MILPKKHITIYESLLGLSNFAYSKIKEQELTVDELWTLYQKINHSKRFPARHSFDNLILSIDILFSLKKIRLTEEGKLKNEDY
jgi:hypothetical protein